MNRSRKKEMTHNSGQVAFETTIYLDSITTVGYVLTSSHHFLRSSAMMCRRTITAVSFKYKNLNCINLTLPTTSIISSVWNTHLLPISFSLRFRTNLGNSPFAVFISHSLTLTMVKIIKVCSISFF